MTELENAIKAIDMLLEDTTVPKNIKIKLENIKAILNEDAELSIKVHKALNELDEISNDINLQPYTRTQLWNIASLLEML
ncbi:hypothetical protein DRJ17_01790 [Candidatus Woesearchaeota archaeon]|nr:MAG: hypothetical protein DRJ17_01790 [Candidatus Woesearchaeota archaeon]